jgi:hypothetical protein
MGGATVKIDLEKAGPTAASEIGVSADDLGKTEEDIRRTAARRAFNARKARRDALRASGADVGVSRETLAGDLEARLEQRTREVSAKFRAQQAVDRKLGGR